MKLAIPKGNGEFHLFTNEGLKVGDKVFPLVSGYSHKGEWYLIHVGPFSEGDDFMLACTGWSNEESKREPHTILRAEYPKGEPVRIITDKGYSPEQVYFTEIKEKE